MNEIRQYREAAGITQEELGVKIGVSGVTISRYESGDRTPSAEALILIASILGCEVRDLVPGLYRKAEAAAVSS